MSKQQDTNKQKSLPQEETAELTDELLETVAGGGFADAAFLTLSMFGGGGGSSPTGGGYSYTGPATAAGGTGGSTGGEFHNKNLNTTYSNSNNEVNIIKGGR